LDLVLARIDDRFIHGQVSVGWARKLRAERIILCNDAISGDPWQRRIYASAVAPPVEVDVLDRARTAAVLADGAPGGDRTILLVGGPADMLDLLDGGMRPAEVNVGGMHYAAGKSEMLEFVYVDRSDLNSFRRLLAAGVSLVAQQVPGGRRWPIDEPMIAAAEERL